MDRTLRSALLIAGALGLSVAAVTAFSTGDTGARTIDADVVTDANAFLALEENGDSAHKAFVSTSSGKVQVKMDSSASGVTGTGVNPDSTYYFDEIINVTNQADQSLTVSVTFTGADSGSCDAALTSSTGQTESDYGTTSLSISQDSTAYLGLKFDATGKTNGDTVDCSAKLEV